MKRVKHDYMTTLYVNNLDVYTSNNILNASLLYITVWLTAAVQWERIQAGINHFLFNIISRQ